MRADVELVRADNPSPYTLEGTNTWVLDRSPAYVVDPGPALDAHLDAVAAACAARGGCGGVVLTHEHPDHADGLDGLLRRVGADVAVGRGAQDGDALGPLVALATPGHAREHVAWACDDVVCTGDAVLGRGSVFLFPDRADALHAYLSALRRLAAMEPAALLPGHGPLVEDPQAKLAEIVAHRLARERRLVAALDRGARTVDALLDDAWSDAPAVLRAAATVTLAVHLDELERRGELPDGVERPEVAALAARHGAGAP